MSLILGLQASLILIAIGFALQVIFLRAYIRARANATAEDPAKPAHRARWVVKLARVISAIGGLGFWGCAGIYLFKENPANILQWFAPSFLAIGSILIGLGPLLLAAVIFVFLKLLGINISTKRERNLFALLWMTSVTAPFGAAGLAISGIWALFTAA